MKKLFVIILVMINVSAISQVVEYSSNEILKSKRDRISNQTLYSEKISGTAILRFDENRKIAIFFLTSDKLTFAFADLTVKEEQGIKLAIGEFESQKITIMLADKDKTVSVIFTQGKFQEGYVLQNISKKSIKGLFEK